MNPSSPDEGFINALAGGGEAQFRDPTPEEIEFERAARKIKIYGKSIGEFFSDEKIDDFLARAHHENEALVKYYAETFQYIFNDLQNLKQWLQGAPSIPTFPPSKEDFEKILNKP